MAASAIIDLQAIVDRFLSHSSLPSEAQRAIMNLSAVVAHVSARQRVDNTHNNAGQCSFVSSGLIASYRQISNGKRQITAFHIPGDLSRLHCTGSSPAFGGVFAIADSLIIRIPYSEICSLAGSIPSVGEALWRECAMDMALLAEWVVNLGRRNAKARTAHLFCEMAVRFNQRRLPTLSYDFPITQRDLGCALGMTGVHLNRVLAELRSAHILTMKSGQVRILDWHALASLADFDAAYLQPILSG